MKIKKSSQASLGLTAAMLFAGASHSLMAAPTDVVDEQFDTIDSSPIATVSYQVPEAFDVLGISDVQWSPRNTKERYAIQLSVLAQGAALIDAKQLQALPQAISGSRLLYQSKQIAGQTWYAVYWGGFHNREQVWRAQQQLPENLDAGFLRLTLMDELYTHFDDEVVELEAALDGRWALDNVFFNADASLAQQTIPEHEEKVLGFELEYAEGKSDLDALLSAHEKARKEEVRIAQSLKWRPKPQAVTTISALPQRRQKSGFLERYRPYLRLGAGSIQLSTATLFNELRNAGFNVTGSDSLTTNATELAAGLHITPRLSAELGWFAVDEIRLNLPVGQVNDPQGLASAVQAGRPYAFNGATLAFNYLYPVNRQLRIGAHLGALSWSAELAAIQLQGISLASQRDLSGTAVSYAVSSDYLLGQNFRVGGRYSLYDVQDSEGSLSLTILYQF